MYPDDSVQSYASPWWTTTTGNVSRGRLLLACVPYPDQKPNRLILEGRGDDPTDHTRARVRIEPFSLDVKPAASALPVAALPLRPGESLLIHRGKVRPVIVLADGGETVPDALRAGLARYQTAQFLVVAPCYCYGLDKDATRGAYPRPFSDRVRRAAYSRFVWDQIPGSKVQESLVRLDHIFPIGKDPASYKRTEHCLSDEAMAVLDEWLAWFLVGTFPPDSLLADIRMEIAERYGFDAGS